MRVKTKAEIYRQSNEECARIILADPERYSAGSLLAIWAARILEQSGVVPTERRGAAMSRGKRYQLDCFHCRQTIELPAGSAEREPLTCPRCGAKLLIDWQARGRALQRFKERGRAIRLKDKKWEIVRPPQ